MKFLVDAQLPRSLSIWLNQSGHDAIHTLELPRENLTADNEILNTSIRQRRIVITKDTEFFDNFIVLRQPYKLLMVTTGNIRNEELLELFRNHIGSMAKLFRKHSAIELNQKQLIVHI